MNGEILMKAFLADIEEFVDAKVKEDDSVESGLRVIRARDELYDTLMSISERIEKP